MIDIDEYIAELEIMKIKQEYSFIDIDDKLPPWSVIINNYWMRLSMIS